MQRGCMQVEHQIHGDLGGLGEGKNVEMAVIKSHVRRVTQETYKHNKPRKEMITVVVLINISTINRLAISHISASSDSKQSATSYENM